MQTRDGAATSILLASDRDLDADLCTRVPRLSAPTIEVDGAPDVYGADGDTVFSCGEWTVMASADGWYGSIRAGGMIAPAVPPTLIAALLIVGTAITMIAALAPARRATRTTPIEALRAA